MWAAVQIFPLVLCAAVAAVGYGSALSALLRIDPNPGDRGILGLLSFGLLGCLLNFAIPLTPDVHNVILTGGIGIAAVLAIRRAQDLRHLAVWAAVAVIFGYVLTRPQSTLSYDSGLYHLQTLRWITEYPVIPGLGNLHGRLAFNSLLFPIAGIADSGGTGWLANLLVILFVLISLFLRLWKLATGGRRSGIGFWILVLSTFLLSTNQYISGWYGVLNADSFVAVLILYWTCVALGLFVSADLRADLAMALLSAVLAFAIKLSAAPLVLPAVALAWIYRKSWPDAFPWRGAAVAGLSCGVWMLRGITLSGCLLHPVSQTCLTGLPWAESKDQVLEESRSIRSWAREPGQGDFVQVLKDQAWFPGWLHTTGEDRPVRLLLVCVPLGLLAALFRRNFKGPDLAVVTCGLAGGLLFWFVTAPDPRFGKGFLLASAILGASVALAACFDQPRRAAIAPALLLAAMFGATLLGYRRVASDYVYTVPEIGTHQLKERGGRRIFVPAAGDQCWNHELPCSPYFDSSAIERIEWPRNLPQPLPGWIPDKPEGIQQGVENHHR